MHGRRDSNLGGGEALPTGGRSSSFASAPSGGETDDPGCQSVGEAVVACGPHSLATLRLITGRMHQIRAHARHIGHPVAGDRAYGDETFNREMAGYGLRRLFLHAESLAFTSGGRRVTVTAPLPPALLDVVAALGGAR